jgi:hypothetical protein
MEQIVSIPCAPDLEEECSMQTCKVLVMVAYATQPKESAPPVQWDSTVEFKGLVNSGSAQV